MVPLVDVGAALGLFRASEHARLAAEIESVGGLIVRVAGAAFVAQADVERLFAVRAEQARIARDARQRAEGGQ
jgi:hypothetical protein